MPSETPTDPIAVQTPANESAMPDGTNSPVSPEETADKRTRAVAALLADPGASNPVLAERAGCSDEYSAQVAALIKRPKASYRQRVWRSAANNPESPVETAVGAVQLWRCKAE